MFHMKCCSICKVNKSLDEFHRSSSTKDGRQRICKPCNIQKVKKWQEDNPEKHKANWERHSANRSWLVRKARHYNIDVDDLDRLIKQSDGKCAICKCLPVRWTVIDHCHDTDRVRGILCEKCNQALGLFGDSLENLESAIQYLTKEKLKYSPFSKQERQKYK